MNDMFDQNSALIVGIEKCILMFGYLCLVESAVGIYIAFDVIAGAYMLLQVVGLGVIYLISHYIHGVPLQTSISPFLFSVEDMRNRLVLTTEK